MQPTRAEFVAERGELKAVPPVGAVLNQHFNAVTSWGGRRHRGGQACLRVATITPALGLALCLAAGAASADGPGLGKPLTEADIAAWDISIEPDGKGLPAGAGTPAQGARIYAEKCAACHGPEGKGGVAGVTAAPLPPLVGGGPITDISAAMKRIANFWPYPRRCSTTSGGRCRGSSR